MRVLLVSFAAEPRPLTSAGARPATPTRPQVLGTEHRLVDNR